MSTESTATASTALVPRSNTLNVYDRVADPLAFAEQMSKDAASMMGAPLDQGRAIALHALCEGLTLVQMQRRYHWISGKPSMRYDAMLAEFRMNHAGSYRFVEWTPEVCEVEFIDKHGETMTARATWDEMKQSRWPWKDWKKPEGERELKDNWATPTDRKTMILSKLVGQTMRAFCPELAAGILTEEEAIDLAAESTVIEPAKPRPTIEQRVAMAENGQQATQAEAAGEELDAEFKVVDDPAESRIPLTKDPGSIAERQVELVNQLFDDLGMSPDKRTEVLSKRNANSVRNLSCDQADEIIDRLRAAVQQRDQAVGN